MRLFKLFGIVIKINYLLIPIWVFSIYYEYFHELILVMLVIVTHELAHSFVAIYYGVNVTEIELFPFGGVARAENYLDLDPFKEMVISIVGPIVNFVLLLIAIMIQSYITTQVDILLFFIFINLTIGLFNMLPILPLDGGRILRAYLSNKIGFKKATKFMIKLSKIIASSLFIISIYLGTKNTENFFLTGIAIFLYFKAHNEAEKIGYTFIYQIVTKKKQLLDKGIMDVKYLTALESIDLRKVLQEFSTSKYHFVTVINTKGKVLGNISESEILDAIIQYNYKLTLANLLEILKK
ncbi:M50 family metallopeptidase [Natronincola ferrireducens]|uniref:Stage IV sporulation protein FB n=1 Tax=Natronincola ferrireducens TaxID=393762 RepID=A0A1G9D1T5_9FIRM|nr:M50 family metallopeptidase [Natronincola ferrireducens]SDK57881.1 stage IV sporulation protein FB [Natronincola ferrireducens]